MAQETKNAQAIEDNVLETVKEKALALAENLEKEAANLSDIIEQVNPQGHSTKLREWIDQRIKVVSIETFLGQYGVAAWVRFVDEKNVLYNTVIGGSVALPRLLCCVDHLPVWTTVRWVEGGGWEGYFDLE
jgi:hypothetical protein